MVAAFTDSPTMLVILEDDPRRSNEMRRLCARTWPHVKVAIFDDARKLLEWLAESSSQVTVMSLDCDLDTTAARTASDPGSGADVVAHLATRPATFGVVIHSSNVMRAPAMHTELALAGWAPVLIPYTDGRTWVTTIEKELRGGQTDTDTE